MRPPLPSTKWRPPIVTTHPSAATPAPIHFMVSGLDWRGVSPSRGLIFKKPASDATMIAAPTSDSSLPVPLAT